MSWFTAISAHEIGFEANARQDVAYVKGKRLPDCFSFSFSMPGGKSGQSRKYTTRESHAGRHRSIYVRTQAEKCYTSYNCNEVCVNVRQRQTE